MKRLLTYLFLVLGLFWCNFEVANSKESINICYNTSTGVTYLATFKCDEYIYNKQISLKEYLLVNVKKMNNRHDIKDLNKKLKIAQTDEEKKYLRRKIFIIKSRYFNKFIHRLLVRYFDQNEVLKALPSSISNFDRQLLAEAFIRAERIVAKVEKERESKAKKRFEAFMMFDKALEALTNKNWHLAERLFTKFINENPKDKKAGEAQYWLAETFRIRLLNQDAATAYLDGYEKYPRNQFAPQGLMKLGMMLIQIGEKDQGCLIIADLKKHYPKTPLKVKQRSYYELNKYNCPNAKPSKKVAIDPDIDIEAYVEEILIAKKEPKKKEKKKVAKVVEQEQEEFKPVDKDIDNDPPRIEIAEAITVDSQAYTLKGKVKDKSKQIYLTIDGRLVDVKRGKFEVDRFNFDPEIVEEIKIVAIDKWNNKSEKTVKVTVKLKVTEVVRAYEELKPNRIKVSKDKNKIAIIIGVEKYKNMPDCNYCNRDAKAFKAYATRALGVIPSNIISLIGSKATRGEILRAFKISLPRIAGDGGKDINIFFAGHGLASESGEELYIIPQDGDQSLLADTAISRVELIKLIKKVDPKSVTMFFDTCYSGQTRGEQMLVASLRGIRIVEAGGIPDNFTIFTASSSNQGSSHIEEAKQGIFSYYLMKGLEGKADEDRNKEITNGELIAYLKTNVSKEAFTQNREQDPMLSGDPDQILMKY